MLFQCIQAKGALEGTFHSKISALQLFRGSKIYRDYLLATGGGVNAKWQTDTIRSKHAFKDNNAS
jgi:hypothetical protein